MANPQNNERPVVSTMVVTPSRQEPWTVIVQVLQKHDVKLSKASKNYQGYVLTDMEGTMIGAVNYEQHVNGVNRILQPYQRYYISNAFVKDALPGFQLGDYAYAWTLSTRTPIELIHDPIPQNIPCHFNFIKFFELHKWIDHNDSLDIRGLIIHSYPIGDPAEKNTAAEYIIVDEEKKAVIIRIWGDLMDSEQNQVTAKFPQPTMVVITNVKVTTYHGISLATRTNSCVFHNPPLADGGSLLEWYTANSEAVSTMLKEETYKNTNVLLPPPSATEIIPISEVDSSIDVLKAVWVAGSVQLMPAQETLWYKACQNCNKTIKTNITWEFPCTSCGVKAPGQPRCRVGVYLFDGTKALCATLFTPEAEKLIKYTAAELKASDEKNVSLLKEIELAIHKKEVLCFIKCLDRTFQGNNVRTYPILKMYLQSEVTADGEKNAGSLDNSDSGSSSKNATMQDLGTEQLFSPTTKRILEEISAASSQHTASVQSLPVKRPLVFPPAAPQAYSTDSTKGTAQLTTPKVTVDDVPVSGEEPAEPILTTSNLGAANNEPKSNLQSPVKKIKSKED